MVISFFVGVIWCKLGHAFEKEILDPTTEPDAVCLAQNIYFEASVEPTAGKIAVGLVALNRMHDARYPDTICGVVKEGPVKESWKTKQPIVVERQMGIAVPLIRTSFENLVNEAMRELTQKMSVVQNG